MDYHCFEGEDIQYVPDFTFICLEFDPRVKISSFDGNKRSKELA